MKYYKAVVLLATESMELDENGVYTNYDPDTYQDCGVIHEVTARTLEELRPKLEKQLGWSLDQWEPFEERLEYQCTGEHDYRTPVEEQVPFQELWTIIVTVVVEQPVNASELKNQ